MTDLDGIKYYPDRFYIRMNGCDLANLFMPTDDFYLTFDQAAFIHEYYHYLTNITTFQGVRSFHAAFCDLFRLVTILTYKKGLDAFPVKDNAFPDCEYEVGYWSDLAEIFREDDLNYSLALETKNSPSGRFRIKGFSKELGDEYSLWVNGKEIKGRREYLKIDIEDLIQTDHFRLSIGALDEFLSASIDEFLFSKGLSDNKDVFNNRLFYPYETFDAILNAMGLRLDSREKIIIAYYALHSKKPAIEFYDILQRIQKDGQEAFENDPCGYMTKNFTIFTNYDCLLNQFDKFIEEAKLAKRMLTAQLLAYYQDRFVTANALLKKDPLFFVRPFFVDDIEDMRGRQSFHICFSRIKTCFPEPLFIQDKDFKSTRPYEYGADLTVLAIAIYEIIESLEKNRVAKRLEHHKNKYKYFNDAANSDDVSTFTAAPLYSYWHRALNELGLYQFYRDNVK